MVLSCPDSEEKEYTCMSGGGGKEIRGLKNLLKSEHFVTISVTQPGTNTLSSAENNPGQTWTFYRVLTHSKNVTHWTPIF